MQKTSKQTKRGTMGSFPQSRVTWRPISSGSSALPSVRIHPSVGALHQFHLGNGVATEPPAEPR